MQPQKTDISRPLAAPAEPADPPARLTLLSLVNTLLRERWMILATGVLAAAAVTVVTLRQPLTYSATTSFMPQASSSRSAVGGIASQLGISVGEAGSTDSPDFYASLLVSKTILEDVVSSRYDLVEDGDTVSMTFMDATGIVTDEPALREMLAVKYLQQHVAASPTPKLGAVSLTVTTPSASLSFQVAQRMLALVSDFNQKTRQSRAAAEREFTARRLADIRAELHAAERRLQEFLVRNRQYGTAPSLIFEHDRLSRDVALQQQLYGTLAEAYERASIEAVRDTPVITVIEAPEPPLLPDRRMLALKGAVALVIGLGLGALVALLRQIGVAARSGSPDELAEFRELRKEAWRDMIGPWRPLTRWLAGRGAAD